ncbi:MAG: hypothetical protein AYK22_01355 [Thermoplasmatales archaeon SG8-52-3]|nr:MAG: hypothetical protein AYK22_01355 [Thermoplasmatales archaeon SG8-52-3]
MKNFNRKSIVLFLILIIFYSSVIIATAREDSLSKTDIIDNKEGIEAPLIVTQNKNLKNKFEKDEGGEDKITSSIDLEEDFKDTEEEYKDSLVILGNQLNRDGSNDIEKHPVLIILAIASLITIIMICYRIRK